VDESLLRWLLEHGANPNTMARLRPCQSVIERVPPLAHAARLATPAALNMLFEFGAEMYPEAIFWAIGVGRGIGDDPTTLRALIEHGADVNVESKRWSTPLRYAVRRIRTEKVKVLLEYGADPGARHQGRGCTVLEFARQEGREDLVEAMEMACGQP